MVKIINLNGQYHFEGEEEERIQLKIFWLGCKGKKRLCISNWTKSIKKGTFSLKSNEQKLSINTGFKKRKKKRFLPQKVQFYDFSLIPVRHFSATCSKALSSLITPHFILFFYWKLGQRYISEHVIYWLMLLSWKNIFIFYHNIYYIICPFNFNFYIYLIILKVN